MVKEDLPISQAALHVSEGTDWIVSSTIMWGIMWENKECP